MITPPLPGLSPNTPVTTPRATRARAVRTATSAPTLPLNQRLVLFQWMLRRFGVETFDELAKKLDDPELEAFDEENVSCCHYALANIVRMRKDSDLTPELLLAYDDNISRHWRTLAARRGEPGLMPKYFQYLMLLFAEIYLDRYFTDPDALLQSLNDYITAFNADKNDGDKLDLYVRDNLNKLAFWSATGSGKTLVMHVNLYQYRHYLARAGRERELDRVLLLTPPGDELGDQHRRDLEKSGIAAAFFSRRNGGLDRGDTVEILQIQRIGDDMGDQTVAIDAFEGHNLVLVDEGHRGSSGEEWKNKRNQLCADGFAFEYSATFGQAIEAAKKPELTQEYARCILFDYSYRWFHGDGFGKDYHILNLPDPDAEKIQLYLTGCLLAFYQQVRTYQTESAPIAPFRVAPPLCVWVGGSVNAVRRENGEATTDVLDALRFLGDFVLRRGESVARIERLMSATTPLRDADDKEIFLNLFGALRGSGLTPEALYEDALRRVFHAPGSAHLHIENLKGSDGEIALRVGPQNAPFGLINVGDSVELWNLCKKQPDLVTTEQQFSGSLFSGIDNADSTLTMLVGSKKFSTGWSSWRVSTMGLLRVGRSEGAEIIQLFGRGVRLRGYNFGLKRSSRLHENPAYRSVAIPGHLPILETLNVFGVKADYMNQFKEALEADRNNEPEWETIVLPVLNETWNAPLKMLRLKSGCDFLRDGPRPTLAMPDDKLRKSPVKVDWYSKVEVIKSVGVSEAADVGERYAGKLTPRHLAFLDWNALAFEVSEYAQSKNWHNLLLPPERLRELLNDPDWYTLLIPEAELTFGRMANQRVWQEIAAALLKKYCEKYYKHRKNAYEMPLLEYRPLDSADSDGNFVQEYTVQVKKSQMPLVEEVRRLRDELEAIHKGSALPSFKSERKPEYRALRFPQHLYYPLISLNSDNLKISPVGLNKGEREFVEDLQTYYNAHPDFFVGRECWLLRNQSRKGLGFFEAGNFYPDFLLWLVSGEHQYLTFVDPKGIRNLNGLDDPKIRFYSEVKEVERRLGDTAITLNSFILSQSNLHDIPWRGKLTVPDLAEHHVLFQSDKPAYVDALLHRSIEITIDAQL